MNEVVEESDAGSLAVNIVSDIAARQGVEPNELQPPLAEAIDPDALETIIEESQNRTVHGRTRVEFEYCKHRIVVQDGDIQIQAIAGVQRPPNSA